MNRISEIAAELHEHSSAGVLYARNDFDKERFTRIRELAAELLSISCDGIKADDALELFCDNSGYQTPKIDTRAVIFNEKNEILLIHDYDGKWALPGGWCDRDQSIYSNTVKEAYEEAGLVVTCKRLVCAHNHKLHNNAKSFFSVIRFFVICEVVSGEFKANNETTESGYFSLDNLPSDLNDHKTSEEQIRLCYEALNAGPSWVPVID